MQPDYEAPEWVPEGSIVNADIRVVQWIDAATGKLAWMCFYDGDVPISQVLGLMELAKADLMRNTPGLFRDD